MCTVTFIPRDVGYYLAMNRDEQLKRIAGLPPQKKIVDGRTILCPSEPTGGTWISLNDAQVCFALINWYSVTARVATGVVSRGKIVESSSTFCTPEEAGENFANLPLRSINPFRLIGIFPDSREAIEWRWNLKKLVRHDCGWKPRQWISSGYDEPQAQIVRGSTFERMSRNPDFGTLDWLRQLHSSHSPKQGPFSTCMHREGAGTVSYTEVIADDDKLGMNYREGCPCQPTSVSVCFLAKSLLRFCNVD